MINSGSYTLEALDLAAQNRKTPWNSVVEKSNKTAANNDGAAMQHSLRALFVKQIHVRMCLKGQNQCPGLPGIQ